MRRPHLPTGLVIDHYTCQVTLPALGIASNREITLIISVLSTLTQCHNNKCLRSHITVTSFNDRLQRYCLFPPGYASHTTVEQADVYLF